MRTLSYNLCIAVVLAVSSQSSKAEREGQQGIKELHAVHRTRLSASVGEHPVPTAEHAPSNVAEAHKAADARRASVSATAMHVKDKGGFSWEAFGKSFGVIALAELFDQTWFLTLVLALRFGWKCAFLGGFGALSVHTVLCAMLGMEISKHIMASTLQFATACLFSVFAIFWGREAYLADTGGNFLADSIAEAEEECDEAIQDDAEQGSLLSKSDKTGSYSKLPDADTAAEGLLTGTAVQAYSSPIFFTSFYTMMQNAGKCFLFLLIGEMGDKTQFAMISLNGTLPVWPVVVGCELAFGVLVLSATLCAEMVKGQSIKQRYILGCVAATFVVFAILAINDAIELKSKGL